MRIPESLASLFEYGIVEEVVRPLMSGKEAQVFLVRSRGVVCVAKVYKEAQDRTFKNRAEYTEGRKVRNSRDQRAIAKRSKHGRAQDEAAWRSTEVDMIYRLHAGGVRVPSPHHFIDGVLIMELIADAEGNPAPRLGDMGFEPHEAQAMYERLIREVVRMLCVGVVHGDLSDFNVLVGADGPVVIDFPQSVDTAHNTNARRLLLRDVDNLHRFLTRYVPNARRMPYAEEMWDLYQQNLLTPETRLGGRYRAPERRVDTTQVLDLIGDANRDERKRRDALGLRGGPPQAPRDPAPTDPRRHETPRGPAPTDPRRHETPRGPAPSDPRRHDAPREPAQASYGRHETPRGPAQASYGRHEAPRGSAPSDQRRHETPRGPAPIDPRRHDAPRGPAQTSYGRHEAPRGPAPSDQRRHDAPRGPAPTDPRRHDAPRGPAPTDPRRHDAPRGPAPTDPRRHDAPRGPAPSDPRRHDAPRGPAPSDPRRHDAPRGPAPTDPRRHDAPRGPAPNEPRRHEPAPGGATEYVPGPRNRRGGGPEGAPREPQGVEVLVVRGPPRRPR